MGESSGMMPPIALSGGALLTVGISYVALSNQVEKMNENMKKSDIQLIKMIHLISDHNDSILKVSDIEDVAKNNSKLLSQMIDTNQELLKRLRESEYRESENDQHLKHIENFLYLDDRYQPFNNPNSYYDNSSSRNINQDSRSHMDQSDYYTNNTNTSRSYDDESNYSNSQNYSGNNGGHRKSENDRGASSSGVYNQLSNSINNNNNNNNDDDEDMDEDKLLKRMRDRR